jgi:hypothetical protein
MRSRLLDAFAGGGRRAWRTAAALLLSIAVAVVATASANGGLVAPAGLVGIAAVIVLVAGVAGHSTRAVGCSIALLALALALGGLTSVRATGGAVEVAACGAGLFVTAELATWSIEGRVRLSLRRGVDRRRWGFIAACTILGGALGVASLEVASTGVGVGGGLLSVALGGVAACLVLAMIVTLAANYPFGSR